MVTVSQAEEAACSKASGRKCDQRARDLCGSRAPQGWGGRGQLSALLEEFALDPESTLVLYFTFCLFSSSRLENQVRKCS